MKKKKTRFSRGVQCTRRMETLISCRHIATKWCWMNENVNKKAVKSCVRFSSCSREDEQSKERTKLSDWLESLSLDKRKKKKHTHTRLQQAGAGMFTFYVYVFSSSCSKPSDTLIAFYSRIDVYGRHMMCVPHWFCESRVHLNWLRICVQWEWKIDAVGKCGWRHIITGTD